VITLSSPCYITDLPRNAAEITVQYWAKCIEQFLLFLMLDFGGEEGEAREGGSSCKSGRNGNGGYRGAGRPLLVGREEMETQSYSHRSPSSAFAHETAQASAKCSACRNFWHAMLDVGDQLQMMAKGVMAAWRRLAVHGAEV